MLKRGSLLATALLTALTGSCFANGQAEPLRSGLEKKLIVGYQGWFHCPGDRGPGSGWGHWFDGDAPTVDMLPDVSDFKLGDTCVTDLHASDGEPVRVFSSADEAVISAHFEWMREYGIDGAAMSRFATVIRNSSGRRDMNQVLFAARRSAEHSGRIFLVTYDLSGLRSDELHYVLEDWNDLEQAGLTSSTAYARQDGMPVLGLWGFGFNHKNIDPESARKFMRSIREESLPHGGVVLLGGVPAGWRQNEGDASADPGWSDVYRSFEILSPWTVGRFSDESGADRFLAHNIKPDLEETRRLGIRYMPVIFPGFSWHNLTQARNEAKPSPINAIPRRCGKFLWHQVTNIAAAGFDSVFTAMFDEVDEGTAIFKTVAKSANVPSPSEFLALDADGCNLPSDWYLKLTGEAARVFQGRRAVSRELPLEIPPNGR